MGKRRYILYPTRCSSEYLHTLWVSTKGTATALTEGPKFRETTQPTQQEQITGEELAKLIKNADDPTGERRT